jgi:predicted protein tyrosine phosphatase
MKILVSPLSQVMNLVAAHAPERIVSLLDPGFVFPETGPVYTGRHLRVQFHDVHDPADGQVVPTTKHMDELLDFLALWSRTAPILIHCRAGISRSTATAFITACLHNPQADEREIAATFRRAAPLARPNGTLIALADAAMSRNGRMSAAIAETGRGLPWIDIDEGIPFELQAIFGPAYA